ncbi:hypothetical protein C1752_00955 [Acaryochloris thomasi RCC1774]|uniref:Uncharacterized protein n=1 Tax=Acaryochloris thomasi RCC1774 TaxID=1764569 RepID=A0A2W1K522_9CYAN|nr:hypothetical protein [Acaryochloris thomasi]PZD74867.1 hypothetical protein C1752_00955 [Acaryochloris thomasi RCC1774]
MKPFYLLGLLGLLLPLAIQPAEAKSCSPYRINYEGAITQGIIRRPSLVSNANQSWRLFHVAMDRNDRMEAASRAAQYLVIVSERNGTAQAHRARQLVESEFTRRYDQPVEVAMPIFEIILANSEVDCETNLARRIR